MTDKKKIFVVSHSPLSVTGFGNQAYLICRALQEDGHEVMAFGKDYRGAPITFEKATTYTGRPLDGLTILPQGGQAWGEDVIPEYIRMYKPDVVLTLSDCWNYAWLDKIPKTHPWKWVAHYVYDTENMVSFWHEPVNLADRVVVPAKFAQRMLAGYGHQVAYIPHGIDTSVFTPATADEKLRLRKAIGIPPDHFVVGCVAHNQERKMMPRLLAAFRELLKTTPQATLFLHSTPREQVGWDLAQMVKDWNLTNHVMFSDKASKQFSDYFVDERMLRDVYAACDVHALATGGEGFGIPLIEAMACGLPNVTTRYTTGAEFCGDVEDGVYRNTRGVAVPYSDMEWHHTGGMWALVDIPQFAQALDYFAKDPAEKHIMGTKARKFVVDNYDVSVVKEQWKDLVANLHSEKHDDYHGVRGVRIG